MRFTQPFRKYPQPQVATCGWRQSPFVAPLTLPLFLVLVIPQELNLLPSFSSFMTAVVRSVGLPLPTSPHSASGHRQTHSYCHFAVSSPPPFDAGYVAFSILIAVVSDKPIPSSGMSGANKSNFPSRQWPRLRPLLLGSRDREWFLSYDHPGACSVDVGPILP